MEKGLGLHVNGRRIDCIASGVWVHGGGGYSKIARGGYQGMALEFERAKHVEKILWTLVYCVVLLPRSV